MIVLIALMLAIAISSFVGGLPLFALGVLLTPLALLHVVRPERAREIGLPILAFGGLTLLLAGSERTIAGLPLSSAVLLGGLWLTTWIWTSWRFTR